MITRLRIRNLALINDATLDFKKGFNILLGETGAGKSIVLDAVNFVLGSKSDKTLISFGQEIMRVEACFENYSNEVANQLKQLDIEDEGLIIISRSLSSEGKNDIKINGNTVTLTMLKSLTILLADSYLQHENLLLLKEKNHLSVLDGFAGELLYDNKSILKNLLDSRSEIIKQINNLGGNDLLREREIDFLKYQIDEIDSVNPSESEEKNLQERLEILSSGEKIMLSLQQAYYSLNQGISVSSQIKNAEKSLSNISNIAKSFSDYEERLTNCFYEIQDISDSLNDEIENFTFDEKELERIDQRLDKYKDLKKKYGNSVEAVLNKKAEMQSKYDLLINCDEALAKLNDDLVLVENKIERVCQELHNQRIECAEKLEVGLKNEFSDLGMKNASFKVLFNKTNYSLNGSDDIVFMFSANLGEGLKPLSKIISGGEMSRFMLAFKNLNVKSSSTLIFDEIDSGISGNIGSAVAKKLANISKYNQVICISHLPQVCVMADNYFYINKTVDNGKTSSHISVIEKDKIVPYIAKLTGGNEQVTTEALAHANQLLNWANEYKNNI